MKWFLILSLICTLILLTVLMVVIITITYPDYDQKHRPIIVCHFPNWRLKGFNRRPFIVSPEEIDATLCTHLHYAFHVIDEQNSVISDYIGPQPHIYQRLHKLKLKNPDLKVIVKIGGWDHDPAPKFSRLVSNKHNRSLFINNTIDYLQKYQFDGLDIDWEFPVCWGGDCRNGPPSDRENFAQFIKEIKTEFDKRSPKLSLSITAVGEPVNVGFDFERLNEYVDYISILTFDMASGYDGVTGHHSPYEWSLNAMPYFFFNGVDKSKLLLSVPFYGHTFKLLNQSDHTMGAYISSVGKTPNGERDQSKYSEICDLVKNQGWKKGNTNHHDPYAYHRDIWVGYDDPKQAYLKSKWIKDNGFGGIMVWEITQDDIHGSCCNVKYPMLRAVNYGLYGTGQNPSTYNCE